MYMRHTGKLLMVALFVVSSVFAPIPAFAATQEELNTQRIELINQLIVILQAKVAELTALLDAQQAQITTINQPVFGSVTMPTQSAITVSTEFGKGSWDSRENDQDRFRDGMVKFIVNSSYKRATIEYHEKGKEKGDLMDLSKDGIHGYFQPNTEYVYTIETTNDAGQVSHVEGTFKTGKY